MKDGCDPWKSLLRRWVLDQNSSAGQLNTPESAANRALSEPRAETIPRFSRRFLGGAANSGGTRSGPLPLTKHRTEGADYPQPQRALDRARVRAAVAAHADE